VKDRVPEWTAVALVSGWALVSTATDTELLSTELAVTNHHVPSRSG